MKLIFLPSPLLQKKLSDIPAQFFFIVLDLTFFVKDLKLDFSPRPNRKKASYATVSGFLLSKSYEFSAKIVHKSYLSWHWRMMQSLRKNWLVVSNMRWRIWCVFTQTRKSLRFFFRLALFVQSIQGLRHKNTKKLSFATLNSDGKFE